MVKLLLKHNYKITLIIFKDFTLVARMRRTPTRTPQGQAGVKAQEDKCQDQKIWQGACFSPPFGKCAFHSVGVPHQRVE